MIAYLGFSRTTEVDVDPRDLGCGAGEVPCFECEGSGIWAFMEPEIPAEPCVNCKGTGIVLISI
jgi:DnaJ-class molecular chaperone